ncbi:MAG: zinc ABC transporter substrate-binding protein [Bacteroidales bacterium]|nr:zinc ABC transporter substrate-binding protein [Bacteroidales bacterium]
MSDFTVNVLLPPGADHHIWEPLPAQINSLSASEALIINGKLGFEEAWMSRFTQVNPKMKILDLSLNIQLIEAGQQGTEAVLNAGGDDGHEGTGLHAGGDDGHEDAGLHAGGDDDQ